MWGGVVVGGWYVAAAVAAAAAASSWIGRQHARLPKSGVHYTPPTSLSISNCIERSWDYKLSV